MIGKSAHDGSGNEEANMAQNEHDHDFIWYPDNDVLAVIGDCQEAERAVQAIRDLGFGEDDVHLASGDDWVQTFSATGKPAGNLARLVRFFQRISSDVVYSNMRLYEQAVRQGQAVIMVHLTGRERLDEVSQILVKHGAQNVNFFGPLAVERVA
jgi:hypothetical protein